MRIIQRGRMSTTFCKVCGFDTPHIPSRGCLPCYMATGEISLEQQEKNRLDAMELYDGAAVAVDQRPVCREVSRKDLLNKALGRTHPGWSVLNDPIMGWVLTSDKATHAIPPSVMTSMIAMNAFVWCERLIKHGVDGDDS